MTRIGLCMPLVHDGPKFMEWKIYVMGIVADHFSKGSNQLIGRKMHLALIYDCFFQGLKIWNGSLNSGPIVSLFS